MIRILRIFFGAKIFLSFPAAFFPAAFTGVCEKELCAFRDAHAALNDLSAEVIGISVDSPFVNAAFAEKNDLNFPLLSDTEHEAQELYGVRQMKKLYGRSFLGVVRSTFLIDGKGVVRRVWRKVKVAGHADEVLAAIEELNA